MGSQTGGRLGRPEVIGVTSVAGAPRLAVGGLLAMIVASTLAACSHPGASSGSPLTRTPSASPSFSVVSPSATPSGLPTPSSSPSPSGSPGAFPTPEVESCAEYGVFYPCLGGDTGIEFVSAETGWVVGPDFVLGTITGGRDWEVQLDPHQTLLGSDFLDAQHGWVVGISTLFRTDNGGASWQALGEPSLPLWSVHFVSPLIGWGVIGDNDVIWSPEENGFDAPPADGQLVMTTDGGETWHELNGPSNVESVCFANASQGWLGVPGAVYRSTDGGASWTQAFAEPEVDGVPSAEDTFVECASPPSVWVYFHSRGAALSHQGYAGVASVDGRHWQVVLDEPYTESERWGMSVPEGPGSYPGPYSVVSPSTAVFLGWTPPEGCGGVALMVASNGGTTLSPRLSVPLNLVSSAAFINSAVGWVVGAGFTSPASGGGCGSATSEILTTADGGQTWTEQYSGQL